MPGVSKQHFDTPVDQIGMKLIIDNNSVILFPAGYQNENCRIQFHLIDKDGVYGLLVL
jgi:hypothetical protein